jgi:hypothetical protein
VVLAVAAVVLHRQRLFAASVVGSVLCAVLGVWAWRMSTPVYCYPGRQYCTTFSPYVSHLHPLRAGLSLVATLVLALAAVALHRQGREVARPDVTENTAG